MTTLTIDTAYTACRVLFGACSNDRVELFYGAPASALVCGRHAAHLDADDYRIMSQAGTY